MKRFVIILFTLIICFPLTVQASEYSEYIDSFDLSSFNELDGDTKDLLEELGLDEFDYENITNISLSSVLKYIANIFTNKAQGPIKSGVTVIAFILLSSLFKSFGFQLQRGDSAEFLDTITNLIISVFLAVRLTDCIGLCCSTIKLCADFTYAFFPAFCIIVSASGGAMTSFSVNTTLLILAQGLNLISSNFFVPLTNCFLALGICSSIRKDLHLGGIISSLRNIITTLISSLSAIFVSILSVKTAVASRADVLGLRSVRFAINSVVPVIGSSISEGLLSIQSYSSLIKTSVGVVGIIAVCAVFLPAIAEAAMWRLMLSVADMCSQIFSNGSGCSSVKVFKDALLIVNVILILSMVTTIISIGILVAAKTVN
ncbi:MAG: hypothetical protein PUE08_00615 [Eubacteriales bacterium]|nr:hypothetical protein [Eubacteriales bacterium]